MQMKNSSFDLLILFSLIGALMFVAITGDEDLSLFITLCSIILHIILSKRTSILAVKNPILLLVILLFFVLFAYRLMFSVLDVQLYVVDDLAIRKKVVLYGTLLIQSLLIGATVGFITIRKKKTISYPRYFRNPSFKYLRNIAWLPLTANFLLYLFFFKGRAYVDIHTMNHGLVGLILKSVYFSYAAIILMAIGSYSDDKFFQASKWLLVGFVVIYGMLLNLRSPLLLLVLLFVYFFGQRFSTKTIVSSMLVLIMLFSIVGIARDQSGFQNIKIFSLVEPIFGIGEFADTLRFAVERSEISSPLWGTGIGGSFLGITEPFANIYAKITAPEYFADGGGFGFFMLADLVINFGIIGAAFVLFCLGLILVRLHYSKKLILSFVLLPVLYANMFAFVRNDIGSTFRGVVYIICSVLLIKGFWSLFYISSPANRIRS